jgi:uncharacterized LabA/DUF88 family protein
MMPNTTPTPSRVGCEVKLRLDLCYFIDIVINMKTNVYVDGFNLYYGALKNTPFRWLDLAALCQIMLPDNDISQIKYYTARVTSRTLKPRQAERQEIYLRALRTIPNLEIILGHFSAHRVTMYKAGSPIHNPQYVDVIKTEEKGSDVNLATDLLDDAWLNDYEAAVLITNDSDLERPVRRVRERFNVPVVILNPNAKRPSKALARRASIVKPIRSWHLKKSQFPEVIKSGKRMIFRPNEW